MSLLYRMSRVWRCLFATACCVVAFVAASATAHAQETGFMLRETELKAKPFVDAQTLAKLPEKAPVTVVSRQGGWTQVKSASGTGWIRMLSMRLGSADPAAKPNTSFLAALGLGRTSRSSTGGPSVTTGVRGFSEEELKVAKPDPAQLAKLGEANVGAGDAALFAKQGGLIARSVPFVDEDGDPIKEDQ
jgi:hypothetical protein